MNAGSFPLFDRSKLEIRPLAERHHDIGLDKILQLDARTQPFSHEELPEVADLIADARTAKRPVIAMLGAHVIKRGCSRFIVEMMKRGLITHLAMNGACAIHDFELALIGATSEAVGRYIMDGRFGLWQETNRLHQAFKEGVRDGLGLGESVGRAVEQWKLPNRDISIFAAGYRLHIPTTLHVGIGYDIIHEHPECDGAVIGEGSYRDFLIFTKAVESLEGGVLLNFGTAVMGPEVYLKALSMARNVARQRGESIREFATAVFDLQDIPASFRTELPKQEYQNYYRPWKTILVRTVADGGRSFYFRGDHAATIPALWRALQKRVGQGEK